MRMAQAAVAYAKEFISHLPILIFDRQHLRLWRALLHAAERQMGARFSMMVMGDNTRISRISHTLHRADTMVG